MNQYIQLRNNTYHFRFKVPHHLRSLINRTEIIRTLKTDSHQLACIKVSAKSVLIYQLKNTHFYNYDELVGLLAKLLDFSEQSINIDSQSEIKTTDQFQELFNTFMQVNPSAPTPNRNETSNIISEQNNLPNGTTTNSEAPYLLSKAWSDFADFKTWNEKRTKEYTYHYNFILALWGDVDVKTINKQDIRKCLKAFELMPQGNKKPYNKLTMVERLKYPTDEIPEEDFISPKTVKSLLKTNVSHRLRFTMLFSPITYLMTLYCQLNHDRTFHNPKFQDRESLPHWDAVSYAAQLR